MFFLIVCPYPELVKERGQFKTYHLLITLNRLKVIYMPTEEKATRKLRAILSAEVKGYSLLLMAYVYLAVHTTR